MKSEKHFPRIAISVERESIPIEQMSPSKVPDEKWKFVDKEGHGHFWQGEELPTLDWWVTGTTWIGDEYDASEIQIGEWRCKLCGETVGPRKKPEYGPTHVPGLPTIKLSINSDDYILSQDEYARAVAAWQKLMEKRFSGRLISDGPPGNRTQP